MSAEVSGELLAVLVGAVLLSALARRYNVSSPLALVVAGLIAGMIPGIPQIEKVSSLYGSSILDVKTWYDSLS